ncbi:hypothetical protein F1847_02455 [Thermodesulfobacterium sp. TA1]|uniref:hypothetical protein n=1 Tax=Thermodesulfobacterium sp. TA1 TaxID=2234087 RepID=UPI001231FB9E|nr:hypothetical protein [Thermodesulfobacterium sp. TA1]QER41660.1 hypothetical protein F1847_02455 [Thermodesulfobacterium sp. TA1]
MSKRDYYSLWGFLCAFFLFLIVVLNFSVEKVTGKPSVPEVKRGYIFDRNLEPLVITLENHKAYYVIKNDNWMANTIPPVVKNYLPSTLNLPKKGIVLLSEDLTLDEVEKLAKEENVLIERSFKRKNLVPEMDFLIGETFNGYGVSGLEKKFDHLLQKGEPLVLSLDLKKERKFINVKKQLESRYQVGLAEIDLSTGEVLAYIDDKEKPLFEETYLSSIFGIPNKNQKISLWDLGGYFLTNLCGKEMSVDFVKKSNRICNPDLSSFPKEKRMFFIDKTVVRVYFKDGKMLIAALKEKSGAPEGNKEDNKLSPASEKFDAWFAELL